MRGAVTVSFIILACLTIGSLGKDEVLWLPWNITFSPEFLTVVDEGESANISVQVNLMNGSDYNGKVFRRTQFQLLLENVFPKHIEMSTKSKLEFRLKDVVNGFTADVEVVGVQVGMSKLQATIIGRGKHKVANSTTLYDVHVLLINTIWNKIFKYGVLISTVLNTVAFACCLDLKVVKKRFMRPWGIIIGFIFQYIFMPSCSYAMGKFFNLSATMAFGLLCMGCCPGGGASNMWTVLLHGEVDLSIAMTVISTTASLAMMPLWLFTLGRQMMINIQQEVPGAAEDVTVPFGLILMTIALVAIPCLIGLLISHYLPRLGKIIGKIVKPFAVLFLLFQIVLGAYTKRYVFSYFSDGKIMIGCMLLPYTAMIASFSIAMICRQGWKKARTIMVETAIQNMALAISVVFAALPHPEADIAIVAPMCAIFANPTVLITLAVGFAVRDCFRKYKRRKSPVEEEVEEDSDTLSEIFGEDGVLALEEAKEGRGGNINNNNLRKEKAMLLSTDEVKEKRSWLSVIKEKLKDKEKTEEVGPTTVRERKRSRKSSRPATDMAVQTKPRFSRGVQPRPQWGSDSSLENGPIVRILKESNKLMKRRAASEEEDDEHAYGKHVATQLRQLPKVARQSLRIRIEQLFLHEMARQATEHDQGDVFARLEQRYAKRKSQVSTGSRLSLLGNLVFGIDMPAHIPRDRRESTGSQRNLMGRRSRPTSGLVVSLDALPGSAASDAPDILLPIGEPSESDDHGAVPSGDVMVSRARITLASPGGSGDNENDSPGFEVHRSPTPPPQTYNELYIDEDSMNSDKREDQNRPSDRASDDGGKKHQGLRPRRESSSSSGGSSCVCEV